MDGKFLIAAHADMWYIYAYICMYVLYAHNLESAQKILWTQHKKGNGRLAKTRHIYALDLSMKKTARDLKVQGRKNGSTQGLLGYSYPEKDARVLFRLDYLSHQHTGLDVIQVFDCRKYFQSCYGTHSSLHLCSLSLSFGQRVDDWIVSIYRKHN